MTVRPRYPSQLGNISLVYAASARQLICMRCNYSHGSETALVLNLAFVNENHQWTFLSNRHSFSDAKPKQAISVFSSFIMMVFVLDSRHDRLGLNTFTAEPF